MTIAEGVSSVDSALERQLVKDSTSLVRATKYSESEPVRRRIVDLAYRIDPDLAVSVASSLDEDEARGNARGRVTVLELKKQLMDADDSEPEQPTNKRHLPRACWMSLGALNANRVQPKRFRELRKLLAVSSDLRLSDAYPVLSWVIENVIHRRGHDAHSTVLFRELFEATLLASELTYRIAARSSARKRLQITAHGNVTGDRTIIHAGERAQALEYLEQWLRGCSEYLWICDPYIGPDELEILQLVLSACPKARVSIVTSKRHQDEERVQQPWSDSYQRHWKQKFSDQEPPDTEIFIVGAQPGGDLPVHDRWWLTKTMGLRFGTAFNGLGRTKDAEISELTEQQRYEREVETAEYLLHRKREHMGKRLTMSIFSL